MLKTLQPVHAGACRRSRFFVRVLCRYIQRNILLQTYNSSNIHIHAHKQTEAHRWIVGYIYILSSIHTYRRIIHQDLLRLIFTYRRDCILSLNTVLTCLLIRIWYYEKAVFSLCSSKLAFAMCLFTSLVQNTRRFTE